MKTLILSVSLFALVCGNSGKAQNVVFVKGADISWLPQMEASGYIFYDSAGTAKDCFQILKECGVNTIRLRAWVNPSNNPFSGHCSTQETAAMAVRAKKWGMRVLIDFHYSDSWADPGKQVKPAAWANDSFPKLLQDVYDYTAGVMQALKDSGVTPDWVQTGNEITPGMLLPTGSTAHWDSLSQLLNEGYAAVKAVSPATKVILHIDQGNNNRRFRTWFDSATAHQTMFDIIGMSYYPYWLQGRPDYTESIDDLAKNMNDMVSRYGKDIMVVEVGGIDTLAENTYQMLMTVQQKVREAPDGKGLGVIYWEPEGARSWSRYPLSAWDNDHKPTKAMEAFK